ncbi:hypothetical protein CY35_06G121600 [Sphagnum magellanicum]|nr:hypothetical protein CY35_06G121600 [Sphagnum magellanicum]
MEKNLLLILLLFLPFALASSPAELRLLRGNIVNKRENEKKRANATLPDYHLYHTMASLLQQVKNIVDRHPSIMQMEIVRSEVDGYSTEMSVVTVSPGGWSVSEKKEESAASEKLRLLLDFGGHARELVTSEVALRLLQMLGGEHDLSKVAGAAVVARLLPRSIIKIVPMENTNGRRRVEAGHLCERKNGRGVDTNRNWDVDWGKKEKDYDPHEEYPGTSAFSEPETRILLQLAKSFNPHVWVNVHSGMEALFMPYDHKAMLPLDQGAAAMQKLLQTLNGQHCSGKCVVGSGGTSVGYLSHGTGTDYMYDSLNVPIALTFEIFGDFSAPNEDCFRMFNPITPAQLESVISKWAPIFFSLLCHLPETLMSMPMRTVKAPWQVNSSSSYTIQDPGLLKQIISLNSHTNHPRSQHVWHGMDALAEGKSLPAVDLQASTQLYFVFTLMLFLLSCFRCSRFYKRLFKVLQFRSNT